jgi:hypothetical protein
MFSKFKILTRNPNVCRSKAWTVLARLDAGIVGSNPTRGTDVYVYVYVYSMFVLSCVGRGLAMSWSLVQGVLPTVLDKETEMKQEVSWMPHAPVGAKKGIKNYYIQQMNIKTKAVCKIASTVGEKLHKGPFYCVTRFQSCILYERRVFVIRDKFSVVKL